MAAEEPINPNDTAQPSGWNDADWEALIRAIRATQCTPFLGAGACAGVLPLGGDIARQLLLRQRRHRAVRLHAGREIVRDEQVRTTGLGHCREQIVHVLAGLRFIENAYDPPRCAAAFTC